MATRTITWNIPTEVSGLEGFFLLRYSPVYGDWRVVKSGNINPDSVTSAALYNYETDPEGLMLQPNVSQAVDGNCAGCELYQIIARLPSGIVPPDLSNPVEFKAHNISSDYRVVIRPKFIYLDVAFRTYDTISSSDDHIDGTVWWLRQECNDGLLLEDNDKRGFVASLGGVFTIGATNQTETDFDNHPFQIEFIDDAFGTTSQRNGVMGYNGYPRDQGLLWGVWTCPLPPYVGYPKDPFFAQPIIEGSGDHSHLGIISNTRYFGNALYEDNRLVIRANGVGIGLIAERFGMLSGTKPWWRLWKKGQSWVLADHGDDPLPWPEGDIWDGSQSGDGWCEVKGHTNLASPNLYTGGGSGTPPFLAEFNPDTHSPLFPIKTVRTAEEEAAERPPPIWNFNTWGYREINITGKSASDITYADNQDFSLTLIFNPPPEFTFPDAIYRIRVIRAAQ